MTNETRERDIYLAKAMGWQYVPPGPETAELYGEGVHCLRDAKGHLWVPAFANTESETWANLIPEFHEWEDAKAKLLRWLAADDNRFEAFYNEIDALYDEFEAFYDEIDALYDEDESARETQFSVVSWSRFLVTLTPARVAEAAEKALLALCAEQEAGNG